MYCLCPETITFCFYYSVIIVFESVPTFLELDLYFKAGFVSLIKITRTANGWILVVCGQLKLVLVSFSAGFIKTPPCFCFAYLQLKRCDHGNFHMGASRIYTWPDYSQAISSQLLLSSLTRFFFFCRYPNSPVTIISYKGDLDYPKCHIT